MRNIHDITQNLSPSYRQTPEYTKASSIAAKEKVRHASAGDISRRAPIVISNLDVSPQAIGQLFKKANVSLLECGHRLLAKRTPMEHGAWLPWLEANKEILGFGERTAQLLIKAAKAFPQPASDLEPAEALKISRQIWGHTPKPAPQISQPRKALPVPTARIHELAKMFDVGAVMVSKVDRITREHPERFKEIKDGQKTANAVYSELFEPTATPRPEVPTEPDAVELEIEAFEDWMDTVRTAGGELADACEVIKKQSEQIVRQDAEVADLMRLIEKLESDNEALREQVAITEGKS
jgi:hypothetical protein